MTKQDQKVKSTNVSKSVGCAHSADKHRVDS